MTGYRPDEALGMPSALFYPPEAQAAGAPERHLEEAARMGNVVDTGWCQRKDGTSFWCSVVITAVTPEDSERRFLILVRDLTQRRELEEQLREAAAIARREAEYRVRESEERFARFAEHLPGLAWIKDLSGRYVYVNAAGARAFGRPVTEVVGRTDEELFPADAAAEFRANDRRVIESGTGIQAVEHLIVPDDSERHSIVSKFPIHDAEGAIRLVGGIAIDITERVQAEAALRLADRRKNEFLATLSHELRNPLAPLRNALHILRQGEGDREHLIGVMEQQLGRVIRLVDDLLELSRITSGKIELRLEPVDLGALAATAAELCRPELEAAEQRLTLELPSEPVRVTADPMRLSQVLENLLQNAAKYGRPGGEGQVRVAVARDEGEAVLRIQDDGVGIPAAMLPQVFDMFAQVDRTLKRSQEGLGIGLALARTLVNLHGGRIGAESPGLGQGSTFTIRLPAIADNAAAGAPEPPRPEAAAQSGAGCRVLVVDDSQDGADSLAMVIRSLGAQARVAYDGQSALAAVAADPPDLVLLDLGMPGMDGFEVAAALRATPSGAGLRLVALTGYGSEEERRRTSAAGFDDHCVKPVDPARLRVLLAEPRPA
jgi:PAS domain S-box-containing protein